MSYDAKCEDLAEAFLCEIFTGDELERHAKALAQEIQDTIEAYWSYLREQAPTATEEPR